MLECNLSCYFIIYLAEFIILKLQDDFITLHAGLCTFTVYKICLYSIISFQLMLLNCVYLWKWWNARHDDQSLEYMPKHCEQNEKPRFWASHSSDDFKKSLKRVKDIFAKIINTKVTSESELFYGGYDLPEAQYSCTKPAAIQLIKHAWSSNEVWGITIFSWLKYQYAYCRQLQFRIFVFACAFWIAISINL